jgi:glycosyltransferase involved in cell wall biosynthesis
VDPRPDPAADRLAAHEQIIRACYQQLGEKPNALRAVEAELAALRASRAVQLAGTLQRLARPFAPAVRLLRAAKRIKREAGLRGLAAAAWRRLRHGPGGPDVGLKLRLDRPLPTELAVGTANHLYLSGWCYHPHTRVAGFRLLRDGQPLAVPVHRISRPDVHGPDDPYGYGRSGGGFYATAPLSPLERDTPAEFVLEVRLRTGAVHRLDLGRVVLLPTVAPGVEPPAVTATRGPLVAVCMATFNPPPGLFERQIASLRAQTHRDWVCIITDDGSSPEAFDRIVAATAGDPQFHVYRNPKRLGFYRNFERCLALVPPAVEFVALADQDDDWRPDKLASLLAAFDVDTTLIYSDMRLVTADGWRMSDTYWTSRQNNYTDLVALALVNTVTGAASMFRRELLTYTLPFPDRPGDQYHDHWLALVAAALGTIRYVDRPLYDYVQHGGNVIGHFAKPQAPPRQFYFHFRAICEKTWLLLDRCGHLIPSANRKQLERVARPTRLWLAARWLTGRGRGITLGAERDMLRALLWRAGQRLRITWTGVARGGWTIPPPPAAAPPMVRITEWHEQKVAPLNVIVVPAAPRRVNVLVGLLDFRYVFGGYITVFHLARRLLDAGRRVRLVIVDECEYRPDRWREQFKTLPGLEDFADRAEVIYAHHREVPVEVHPDDQFVATSWWTAHVAHKAAIELGRRSFVYLSQDYEPLFYPMGPLAALANESYTVPHHAVFSTEFLQDYFRQNRLGVYAAGTEAGDRTSVAFENAITPVGPVAAADLAGRLPRKVLFYARPEPHNARNLFEIGVLALAEAVRAGAFRGPWEFWGIGCSSIQGRIELAHGVTLGLLPRQDLSEYAATLKAHDVGLALMYTPHPSLVPLEMASAGLLTVTNTFANKTADRLRALSSNLIAVEATVPAIAAGLRRAAADVEDVAARARGARVRWSTDWATSFPPSLMRTIGEFLDAGDPPVQVGERGCASAPRAA